jgi:hypothetical protein
MASASLVHVAGWLNLVAAVFHLGFWRLFRWPRSLGDLNPVNRGTLYTMNWALTYFFGLVATVFLCAKLDAVRDSTIVWLLFGMSGFFLLRALVHPYYFRLRHPLSLLVFVYSLLASVVHFVAARSMGGIP